MKKGQDKLTIALDKKIKELYKEFCEKNGLRVGKQIEIFMESELKRRDKR